MNDPVSREEYTKGMDKIDERFLKQDESILRTELAVSKIEASAKYMHDTWLRIHDELYEKDGLKERVLRNVVHNNIHWALISAIVLGIIGRALWVISIKP